MLNAELWKKIKKNIYFNSTLNIQHSQFCLNKEFLWQSGIPDADYWIAKVVNTGISIFRMSLKPI